MALFTSERAPEQVDRILDPVAFGGRGVVVDRLGHAVAMACDADVRAGRRHRRELAGGSALAIEVPCAMTRVGARVDRAAARLERKLAPRAIEVGACHGVRSEGDAGAAPSRARVGVAS